MSHKKLLIVVALLLVSSYGVGYWLNHKKIITFNGFNQSTSNNSSGTLGLSTDVTLPDTFFVAFQKQLNFPIYIPKTMPIGYTVVSSSFKIVDNQLNFYIKTKDGVELAAIEQLKPATFVSPKKNNSSRKVVSLEPVSFTSKYGKATLFQSGDNSIALLEATNTLVIINVNGISSATAKALINGLEIVK